MEAKDVEAGEQSETTLTITCTTTSLLFTLTMGAIVSGIVRFHHPSARCLTSGRCFPD
ncbi:hypothetical protein KIN20_013959 [Parelaphostrongylus tenuis]|uniref:Uncharacterized protein n=1 Tax=Parelaphostrongylus tenuis TaxID=148309 RepID=A0AAD5QLC5_PARTN|nr:hypothetical protein KIN20_013959 [Parelaphostrongylus tenuis]